MIDPPGESATLEAGLRRVHALAPHREEPQSGAMTVRSLFETRLYEAELGDENLLRDLAHSIRMLAEDDAAGRRWSRDHHYAGYTSYASLNDLPKRDPAFADLARLLARHAATFAEECAFDLKRK